MQPVINEFESVRLTLAAKTKVQLNAKAMSK